MDGKIVYKASKNTLGDLLHEEDLACRYHIVDSYSNEVVEGYNSYDEAESSAKIRAAVHQRDFYVVDSQYKDTEYIENLGPKNGVSWLSRLWRKLFG